MSEGVDRGKSFVAVTLAAAAVLAALLGARAATLFSTGSSDLESAVRTEVKSGAAVVEVVRFVYQGEAPQAYRYARFHLLAEEYRHAAQDLSGTAREIALAEAEAQEQAAKAMRNASEIAKTPKYGLPGGSFDVGKRLADVRNRNPELVALDPEALQRDGNRTDWHANLVVAVTLAPALAFLLGALAQTLGGYRRPLLAGAWLLIAAGIAAGAVFEVTLP